MPVARLYTKSQWDAFAHALDALPEKPEAERGIGVRDAMKEMRAHIRRAQTRGYTLEQIAEQATQAGIAITAGTIRYALRSGDKGNSAGKANSAGNAARPEARAAATGTVTTLPRAHGAAQGGASRSSSLREIRNEARTEARPHGGKVEVKPQPMPVQGSLAFAIRPDTDDL
jgi:hypothetical protein